MEGAYFIRGKWNDCTSPARVLKEFCPKKNLRRRRISGMHVSVNNNQGTARGGPGQAKGGESIRGGAKEGAFEV